MAAQPHGAVRNSGPPRYGKLQKNSKTPYQTLLIIHHKAKFVNRLFTTGQTFQRALTGMQSAVRANRGICIFAYRRQLDTQMNGNAAARIKRKVWYVPYVSVRA